MLSSKVLLLLSTSILPQLVTPWSPTNSYAPGKIDCPDVDSLVRPADSISTSEKEWIEQRHAITDGNLAEFLDHWNLTDFSASEYLASLNSSINIGIAFSGGGYRAMFAGAGQLAALDNQTEGAWEHGLGGLLESTTYFSGLSGGNWLLGTVVYNNWTSVQKILDDGEIWDLANSFVTPYGEDEELENLAYWKEIIDDVKDKSEAGFLTSITDVWGRGLSDLFFPGYYDSGAGLTVSTLRDAPVFQNHQMPFPIHLTLGRPVGTYVLDLNSTDVEVNPFELGSWDPSLFAFTDVKYLGTSVEGGKPTTDTCIGGFDNAGFIIGTSSSLFNELLDEVSSAVVEALVEEVETLIQKKTDVYLDVAIYKPNPFYKTDYAALDTMTGEDSLYLVDGGIDGQLVPFAPLIQPDREVDIVIAFDNAADTDYNWPNGSALSHTYDRQFDFQGNGTTFPYVPPPSTMLELNLTHKPTFFGCDSSNLTSLSDSGVIPPLVVYISNTYMSYNSNTSTYKLAYDEEEKRSMITNGFETTTRMNMTLDNSWGTCLSCAIIRRSQEKAGIEQSEQCKECFEEYCWDGTVIN